MVTSFDALVHTDDNLQYIFGGAELKNFISLHNIIEAESWYSQLF
jgi:hypothetical protein